MELFNSEVIKMVKRYKGNICRATKSQKSKIRSVCRKYGRTSKRCKATKRRVYG